jgi:hypothetical protein
MGALELDHDKAQPFWACCPQDEWLGYLLGLAELFTHRDHPPGFVPGHNYGLFVLARRKKSVFPNGGGMVTVLVPLFQTGGKPQGDQLNRAIFAL